MRAHTHREIELNEALQSYTGQSIYVIMDTTRYNPLTTTIKHHHKHTMVFITTSKVQN